jgi:hypothetical protein
VIGFGFPLRPIDWSKQRLWTSALIRAERKRLDMAEWGSQIEIEVRNRIRAAVAAYAYEIESNEIMSDAEFDKLVQSIRPRLGTCHPLLDEFFITRFSPMTGMWIHDHPELAKVRAIYRKHHA